MNSSILFLKTQDQYLWLKPNLKTDRILTHRDG